MRNDKIKTFHKKYIESLENTIKELEQENKVLTDRNLALKNELDSNNARLLDLTGKIYDIQTEYEKSLNGVKELKGKYKTLIKDVLSERKKFKQEYTALLKKMRKN